ncbi:chymotrypsin/elastase isoinhibitors 2 to 5-like [Formica exsecta]|uniref:chymotrypsin/elastase isoinhibitors 2 to 5-like n=1 Tax=Formica exsecta TaxID=72781 RepID=UPI0011440B78|nr:chymotrypsin/elastase isoinhibitors 2 to 5-like [Formica exsecta]
MARLIALFLLFVTVCVYGYSTKPQPCGSNEEWNKCAVPIFCELKCGEDAPKICSKICVSRCQCIAGYKRNLITGLCVSENC